MGEDVCKTTEYQRAIKTSRLAAGEFDDAIFECNKCVIFRAHYVTPRIQGSAALSYNDIARMGIFAVRDFYAKIFWPRIATQRS